ncbi:hypothetical protein [Roseobacter sp. MH60115]|uniref:hypothetical protein n=1 Tax=Roseobacter sp. MH60115 TaxID=2785324 RepID=UPI001E3440BD|nr:hypothetical protein [Roseobacter sp. MH60115]
MAHPPTETHHPRRVEHLGIWSAGALKFKAYSILAEGSAIGDDMVALAQSILLEDVVPRAQHEGESNDLGFVFVHPGALGLTISVHWWCQGSVLCQHNYRRVYGATAPLDTRDRPVIACVWELALINAEQEAWRATMMGPVPDPQAYLNRPAGLETV